MGLMRATRLKQLLFRILVVVIVAGTMPGLGSTVVRGSPAGEVYTVTYDGNGNDGGSVPVDIMSYEQGDSDIVHDNSKGLTKTDLYSAVGIPLRMGAGQIISQAQRSQWVQTT